MKTPVAPKLETRRTAVFLTELRERARAWIPEWDLTDAQGDFGQALLDISARFNSEVAERLDRAGDKMRGGFLDWLGVRGKAARPARVPVVFKLSDSATLTVDAIAPIRLQANAGATPVVFETEKNLTIVPARLQMIVAADPANDAYYLPPPDLSSLTPIDPLPTHWILKSFAPAKATALQLMPGVGLAPGMLIELNGRQYTIQTADKDLVTIDRPLETAASKDTEVDKVESFDPFDLAAANQQEHILYIGDADLLNVEAHAIVGVQNAAGLLSGVEWTYWGKTAGLDIVDWQPLKPLTVQNQPGVLLLDKPAGSVEQLDIKGHNARWIRAYTKKVLPGEEPFTASRLALEINPKGPPDGDPPAVQVDGMANTTPLVLDNLFYPLGKEPRQFDAFYVGSNEAFSKANAEVQLSFEMADRTFAALSAVRGVSGATRVLVGVGQDRALHLLELDTATGRVNSVLSRPPLYPPSPAFVLGPKPGSAISLDKDPSWRPPVWTGFGLKFVTAVCAGTTVWLWLESAVLVQSGWADFGQIPSTSTPAKDISSLIVLIEGGVTTLFALREGRLYSRLWPLSAVSWPEVVTTTGGAPLQLVSIVAVRRFTSIAGSFTEGGTAQMVGFDGGGNLYRVLANGACTPLMPTHTFDTTILPAAVEVDGTLIVAAVLPDAADIKLVVDRGGAEVPKTIPGRKALKALEAVLDGGRFHTLLTATDGNTQALYDWVPFAANWAPTPSDLFPVTIDIATANGGPTEVDGTLVVPGNRADILSATYDAAQRFESTAQIDAGIVVSNALSFLAVNDYVIRLDSMGNVQSQQINSPGVPKDGEVLYGLAGGFFPLSTRLDAFPQSKQFPGTRVAGRWKLDPLDDTTVVDGYIQIGANFFHVDNINAQDEATLTPPAPASANYVPGWITNGRMAPVMRSVPGTWKADVLNRPIGFPDNDPSGQFAKAFAIDASNHPTPLALGREFNDTVADEFHYGGTYRFIVEAAVGQWRRDTGGSTNNPELSWEYWNGRGWSRLNLDRENTLSLQITGEVRFTVPTDIAPSDWAGKTNPWIRARLIGGDYGREKFITTGTTTTRSTEDIRPPSVLNLTTSYRLSSAVMPAFVLSSDSGSLVDQSNANRSPSASVEAFVPLALTLSRLLQPSSTASDPAAESCPPPCNCPGEAKEQSEPTSGTSTAPPSPTTASAAASGPGRCLLIGMDGTVDGADVHLLVLAATEHNYTPQAPLRVDAIVASRFTQIVASDGTRALGETGLVEMSFAVPPGKTDLFGKSLTWLRLSPHEGAAVTNWRPSIGGMYLNAVFAQSTETLTRELLGSVDGSPNLTVTLARPPVLRGTLELRVREPLGDQDLADLAGRGLVVTEGSDYWVKWEQVDDPTDEPAGARVYALDEFTGEIRFGDGLHGMIPPIGRDSIVAFRYQRTEPPVPGSDVVPANGVRGRTPLNLVSPVETVESVTTAAEAAGGSAPESTPAVLKFGFARLRHRERAFTLQDFEDLALESSPWIAQARAFQLSRGRVQVTVIMRGDPLPTLSQIRELRRYLLSMAPATLALPGALTIAPPRLRKLQISLILDVETLDAAAKVSTEVKTRLKALFDAATGSRSGDGWPLGLSPSEDVVASAIQSVGGLASIADIKFFEIDEKGTPLIWPAAVKATDLVALADDPVRLEFHSLEVTV